MVRNSFIEHVYIAGSAHYAFWVRDTLFQGHSLPSVIIATWLSCTGKKWVFITSVSRFFHLPCSPSHLPFFLAVIPFRFSFFLSSLSYHFRNPFLFSFPLPVPAIGFNFLLVVYHLHPNPHQIAIDHTPVHKLSPTVSMPPNPSTHPSTPSLIPAHHTPPPSPPPPTSAGLDADTHVVAPFRTAGTTYRPTTLRRTRLLFLTRSARRGFSLVERPRW